MVIKSRQSKDRQNNGQMKTNKNDKQRSTKNTTQNTKDLAIRTILKHGVNSGAPEYNLDIVVK